MLFIHAGNCDLQILCLSILLFLRRGAIIWDLQDVFNAGVEYNCQNASLEKVQTHTRKSRDIESVLKKRFLNSQNKSWKFEKSNMNVLYFSFHDTVKIWSNFGIKRFDLFQILLCIWGAWGFKTTQQCLHTQWFYVEIVKEGTSLMAFCAWR